MSNGITEAVRTKDKLKIKLMIGYIQNYQRKCNTWTEKVQEDPKTNFILSAKRTNINWASNDEMGAKCDYNMPPGLILHSRRRRRNTVI